MKKETLYDVIGVVLGMVVYILSISYFFHWSLHYLFGVTVPYLKTMVGVITLWLFLRLIGGALGIVKSEN